MNNTRLASLFVASLALGTLTFNLGQWQTRRAEEKLAMETQREEALRAEEFMPTAAVLPDVAPFKFRRVRLQGQFIPDAWVALDNRLVSGRPAVSIVQAFRVEPGGFVLMVDRGLLPRDPAAPRVLPAFRSDAQTVTIQGFFLERFPRTAELWGLRVADASEVHRNGREWSNFNANDFQREFAAQLGTSAIGNYVVQQMPERGIGDMQPNLVLDGRSTVDIKADTDGFYRVLPQWSSDVAKHRGYAFQWYSLTVLLAVMVVVLVLRQRKDSAEDARA